MAGQLSLFESEPTRGEREALARVHAEAREVAAHLPADVYFGTSSWSFPGWAGIVYSSERTTSDLARSGCCAYSRNPLRARSDVVRSRL